MSALVISAFPACGKSTFCREHEGKGVFLDSDSSSYSWISEGVRNPEFPTNYIEHIKANLDKADIIFVSSHEQVRKALQEEGIPYVLIFPYGNLKEEWLNRCRQRGSSSGFVEALERNWVDWISSCANDGFGYPFVLRDSRDTIDNVSAINFNVIHYLLQAFHRVDNLSVDEIEEEKYISVALESRPRKFRVLNRADSGSLEAGFMTTPYSCSVLRFYPKEFDSVDFRTQYFGAELEQADAFIRETGLLPEYAARILPEVRRD